MEDEIDSTPPPTNDPAPDRRLLNYAGRPDVKPPGRLLPANQSFAGMFAAVAALALVWLTGAAIFFFATGAGGEAAAGACCMFVPCTVAASIAGVLGLTEETPQGNRRDGTLAKWSLLATGGCWITVGILLVIAWLLR